MKGKPICKYNYSKVIDRMFLFFTNKLKVNPLFARMTFIVQIQKEKEAPKFHNALLLGNSYRELRENPFYKRKNSKIRLF